MKLLLVNAGSTNTKLSILDGTDQLFSTTLQDLTPAEAVARGLDEARANGLLGIEAVGHRIVHGGPEFTAGVRVTDEVVAKLAALSDLAPLHNQPALAALAETRKHLPGVVHVACFDTAFHGTIPKINPAAARYPVPRLWTENWGIRKYGFHGLSHAYCSRRTQELMLREADPFVKVIVAHLGGGCSLSAILGGRCFDTTMGFTPLDGLMMGTRSGSIDPGVILHVMRHHGLTVDQVEHALNKQSGLLGVSGLSSDIRVVRKAAEAGNQHAAEAIQMFVARIQYGIAGLMTSLGGADAVVFTGGIGENDPATRRDICRGLEFMQVACDERKNNSCVPDQEISADTAKVRVFVVHTREDVTMAREVQKVLEKL